MQAVQAVQKGDPSLRAHYMAALGEWLVQQGTAKEAGKEVLLGAAALLEPPAPATPKGKLKGDHGEQTTQLLASDRGASAELHPAK